MKSLLISILVGFTSLNIFATDCDVITEDNLCVNLEWTEGPYVGAYSSNTVTFTSVENPSIYISPNQEVEFFAYMLMGSHGHGTRDVISNEVTPGVFENTKVFYMGNMTGKWLFRVRLNDKIYTLHELEVTK